MTLGLVDEAQVLAIKSKMRQARVFLDGDHIVHEVTIGDVVTMRRSTEPLARPRSVTRDGDANGQRRRSETGVGGVGARGA